MDQKLNVKYSRNILPNKPLLGLAGCLCFISLFWVNDIIAQKSKQIFQTNNPIIEIIYPKANQHITAVDSTFILGNVPKIKDAVFYKLTINDFDIPVHKSGGFIAFLPISPGEFNFELKAFYKDHNLKSLGSLSESKLSAPQKFKYQILHILKVKVPVPLATLAADLLLIEREYVKPRGHLFLSGGERLKVGFVGTPNCQAWFSIDGLVDSVPMVEINPMSQPYWGESVFGAGAIPDSLLIEGIYTGYLDINNDMKIDSSKISYHLATPDYSNVIWELLSGSSDSAMELLQSIKFVELATTSDTSSYLVSLNSKKFPFTVEFSDSVQTIRHAPRKGYFSIFQPKGVQAEVTGQEGSWYKLQLSKTQLAFCDSKSVKIIGQGAVTPQSYLVAVRTKAFPDKVILEFPLKGKHPFNIIPVDKRTIKIQLFGVTSDTDWIRYDFADKYIDYCTWQQPEQNLYEFTIHLTKDIWGYDSYYTGNTFNFQLNYPPENLKSLKGKRIVIDPGHSHDPGSRGATGYTEAEANLGIALVLSEMLIKKGAIVRLTRSDDSHLPLYDRPMIAKSHDADIFISIHNNALPDGVNPFENNGTSTIYYHPHSIDLAKAIHGNLVKATGLRDHGLLYGNLAVNRPTQYPAVMVECAFMIIPEQEALLKTDKFRKSISKSIIKGIKKFLKDFDNNNR